ncbi:MAG TPA: xanthine dehydrogenase family protein molybdopterin-binding subunit [Thermoanaerobaculia bacterium]|jgi:xanthine dehydrogenase YagR molybdenum-binding subunit|nr:xanthine dehydrogenase family protein molybdopterin-binding subunit [Thermoanaerobaculia bacterium]
MSLTTVDEVAASAVTGKTARTGSVGKPIERVDGRRKVTGTATYAAEFRQDHLAHAFLVQSTIAKGRIAVIDTAAARRAPGVIAVLTHENMPKLKKPPGGPKAQPLQSGKTGEDRLPFSDDVIHYAGQHVALVVADTLEHARHAASLIRVRYQEEKPLLEVAEAMSTAYSPKASFGRPLQHTRGNVEAALAAPGAVKIEQTYTTPVETNNPMEPSATVAHWNGDRLIVADATQGVIGTRAVLATAFGIPKENVRVLCPYTGGGFGCKGFQWPHTLLAAMAAKVTRRPVQLNLTRQQMFTSVGHRPPTVQTIALAANRDGKLTAIRHHTLQPTSPTTEFIEPCGLTTSKLLYSCDNVTIPHQLVRVNVAPPTPMRAPGDCPGTFAIESAMDELAYALGMDPLELRLRNHADKDEGEDKPWSSKHLKECYQRGAEKFGWSQRNPKPGATKDGDLLVGWGMATAIYPGNRRPASARIRISPDGRALVQAATQDLGTGSYTIFTQVAADALGLPVERVTFELGDSDFPESPGSGGSNTAASVSEAILQAAAALKAKLADVAASDPESPLAGLRPEQMTMTDGRLAVAANPSRGLTYSELLSRSRRPSIEAEAQVKPEDEKTKQYSIHSFGAQFCEVKIDPLLPRVQVTRWVSAIDVGRVLNPRLSRSQVMGGVTMGIGMALMEHTVYDPRTGRPVTDNFADYAIPVNADVPVVEVEFTDQSDPVINTLGCRGIGEIGITGVAAAVANAVYHATGKRVRELPITPDKLL